MNRRKPRLIPVLDVMCGQVVRARGGRRHEYAPLTGRLVQSSDPVTVAHALLAATGADELYVADLDAIQGKDPNTAELRKLFESSRARIWLDLGLGPGKVIPHLPNLDRVRLIVGSETCQTSQFARDVLCAYGHEMLAFSIDLRGGVLIGGCQGWALASERDALGIAHAAARIGYRRMIVLDLAQVGAGTGCGTNDLLRAIREEQPEMELIAGGGLKTWDDIDRLGECGVDAVLVASALHDGTIISPRPASQSPRH